jgi:hypothetical protein
MNATSQKITHLSDAEVLRVALWFFDHEREERGDELAGARLKDLATEDIVSDFNAVLNAHGLGPLEAPPDPVVMAAVLRELLIARAEEEPNKVAGVMRGLGMEAGGELLDFLSQNFPYILVVLVLVRNIDFQFIKGSGGRRQLRIKSGLPPELLNIVAKFTKANSVPPDSDNQSNRGVN